MRLCALTPPSLLLVAMLEPGYTPASLSLQSNMPACWFVASGQFAAASLRW